MCGGLESEESEPLLFLSITFMEVVKHGQTDAIAEVRVGYGQVSNELFVKIFTVSLTIYSMFQKNRGL